LADDVYDGVFQKLLIKENNEQAKVIYDDSLRGWEAVQFKANKLFMAVVEWFITHL
jgi:hypothetical protein